jgi:hypothetical protein
MRTAERAARNESVFREANERIERRLEDLSLEHGRSPFLCECEDETCSEVVRLTLTEYEHVREHPRRFLVAPGHDTGEAEIVETHDRYVVVEKEGETGKIAAELDPRRDER